MIENKQQRPTLISSFSVLFAATKAKQVLQAKLSTLDQRRFVGDASRGERRAITACILIDSPAIRNRRNFQITNDATNSNRQYFALSAQPRRRQHAAPRHTPNVPHDSLATHHLSLITAHSANHLHLRCGAILQAVEDQLDAGRDAELVEYPKQIIAHGMFAEAQVAGDLAIGEAFGNQADYVLLALGKQVQATRVLQVQRFRVAERVQQVAEMLAVGPDLTPMHGVNALRKSFQRLVAEDDAVRTTAEGVNHQVSIARGQQHHRARLRLQRAQLAQHAKPLQRTFVQLRADDSDVRLTVFQERHCLRRLHGARDHRHAKTLRPKCALHQLAIHLVSFRDCGGFALASRRRVSVSRAR
jgi:hypothetical protein